MIDALWRRRRLGRVEAGIYSSQHCRILADRARREARTYEKSESTEFEELMDPVSITDPAKHEEAKLAAEQMRAQGNEPTATFGLTFMRAATAFGTLSRYEASLERSYYPAFHEFQRLQEARRGGHVPPPLALDVTVSGQHDGGADVQSGSPDSDGRESRDPRQERETNRVEEHTRQRPAEPERIDDELFG